MIHSKRLPLAIAVVLCALVALSFAAQRLGLLGTAAADAVTSHTAGGYAIEISMTPGPAKALQRNAITVRVSDRNGQPVAGATVAVALSMPNMDCGVSNAAGAETEPGVYVAQGIPLMAGATVADVTVTAADVVPVTVRHRFRTAP